MIDTTPKYVKMCEKAEEIQGYEREDNEWDVYIIRYWKDKCPDCGSYHHTHNAKYCHRCRTELIHELVEFTGRDCDADEDSIVVWLPSQRQSQDIVFNDTVGMQSRCCAIYEFSISVEGANFCLDDGSMEQLWLAYVMYEKYGKVWGEEKEEWVK